MNTDSQTDETTTYTYNANGSIDTITYANGNTAVYNYDDLNRLTILNIADSTTTIASYVYQLKADGMRKKATESIWNGASYDTTTINWTYDALNRLEIEDYNAPGDSNDFAHSRYGLRSQLNIQ